MKEEEFKTIFRNHQESLSNKKYASSTSLSKYIWELKEAKTKYKIKWSILKRANVYRSGGKQCRQTYTIKFKNMNYFLLPRLLSQSRSLLYTTALRGFHVFKTT